MGDHVANDRDTLSPDRIVVFIQKLFPSVNGDTIIAWIRTVVPVFVGNVIVQLIALVPDVAAFLDQMYAGWQVGLGVAVSTAVVGLYYAISRKIEKNHPKAGKWLLGSAKVPVYTVPVSTSADGSNTTVTVNVAPSENLQELAAHVSRQIHSENQ